MMWWWSALALGQSWEVVAVSEGGPDVVPVGAGVRQWGPTAEVFVVRDERHVADAPVNHVHEVHLSVYDCVDDACAAPTLLDDVRIPGEAWFDQSAQPSLAVAGQATDRRVMITHRMKGDQEDCDGDGFVWSDDVSVAPGYQPDAEEARTLSLYEHSYSVASGSIAERALSVNDGQCQDRGVPLLRNAPVKKHACFTVKDDNYGVEPDTIRCLQRGGSLTAWDEAIDLSQPLAGGRSEHSSFVPHGGRRIVAHRAVEGSGATRTERVFVRFPDDPTDPWVSFAPTGGGRAVNYPFMDSGAGVLHLVWSDGEGADERIMYSRCAIGQLDCTDPADWDAGLDGLVATQHQVATVPGMSRPEIALHRDYQALLFMVAQPGGGQEVQFTERCGTEPWSAPEAIVPVPAGHHQSLEMGRPHLAINQRAHRVHVVFAETDRRDDPTSGRIVWAHRDYTTCP